MKKISILTSIIFSLLFVWTGVFADTGSLDVVGSGVVQSSAVDTGNIGKDPYYIMNSANLNTMNSYIIPVKNDIDPTSYRRIEI
jgi:hypothetical protein